MCDWQEGGPVICAAKMKTQSTQFSSKVEPLRCQWEAWSQNRKQGEHIPENLWDATVELAAQFGVGRLCRALGVGYHALKERAQACRDRSRSENKPAAFIELPVPAPTARIDYLVELEDGRGAKMTVRLAPGSGSEVLALAQAFWRRQP